MLKSTSGFGTAHNSGAGIDSGYNSFLENPEILATYQNMENNNQQQQQEDVSLLRQPMRTAFMGFQEAKRAYENGTNEVRRLLMNECSIIYECNACLNMFRSLANFISHKRIFCRNSAINNAGNNNNNHTDQNSAFIIQSDTLKRTKSVGNNSSASKQTSAVPPAVTKIPASEQQPQPQDDDAIKNNRELSKVIERLRREKYTSSAETKKQKRTNTTATTVLQLERVPSSSQAVYQTIKHKDADSIKTEVEEVTKMLSNLDTVLGPDGKAITDGKQGQHNDNKCGVIKEAEAKQLEINGDFTCELCQLRFQTEKTLKLHLQKKHISSTYVLQCPECSLIFLKSSSVIRHLANDHKKPLKRIRMMRESIQKKRVQLGEVQAKGPSRELKRLQLLNNSTDSSEATLGESVEQKKVMSKCIYCEKSFERRAVLSTHLMNCRAKIIALSEKPAKRYKQQLSATMLPTPMLPAANSDNNNAASAAAAGISNDDAFVNFDMHKIHSEDPTLMDAETAKVNEMYANLENQTFGKGLQTVSLDKDDVSESDGANVDTNAEIIKVAKQQLSALESPAAVAIATSTPVTTAKTVSKKTVDGSLKSENKRRFRVVPIEKRLSCRCKICNKQFNALSNLRRHISMFHYRARRFGCKLCEYRAFRRYDIVNHLGFVHKMIGEREAMSLEYVDENQVNYSKDDVESDIVVLADNANANSEETQTTSILNTSTESDNVPLKTYEKRAKRNKTLNMGQSSETSGAAAVAGNSGNGDTSTELKKTRQRLKRSQSQQDAKPTQKRPIRNRIKPENKDFVYDLSSLLKNEAAGLSSSENKETLRCLKRRNTTLYSASEAHASDGSAPDEQLEMYYNEPLISVAHKQQIRGAIQRITLLLVNQGLAKAATLPELPSERPQMRPRLTSTYRGDMQAGPIIETTELEAARMKSTLLDDTFLEKIAKRSSSVFKIKPCMALEHKALNTLLQKVHNSGSNSSNADGFAVNGDNENCVKKVNIKMYPNKPFDILSYQHAASNGKCNYMEPAATIPTIKSPPPTPRKRVSLMQRLAENKAKSRESLLRSALEQ